MALFLLTFFLIYGSVHAYLFLKIHAAFRLTLPKGLLLSLFFVVMVLTPVLVRMLENRGYELTGRGLAIVGYVWMGLLFLFFTSSLAVDLYRLILFVAAKVLRHDFPIVPSARTAFLLPAAYAVAVAAYGYFEARNIRSEHVTIETDKLPPDRQRLRIVQVSDVHLGLIVRKERLERILDAVAKAEPDMVVSTGDFVDGQLNNLSALVEPLRLLDPPLGKFAVTGNHEFYAGLDQAIDFTRRSGFQILRGEHLEIGGIAVAGVDDPAGRGFDTRRQTQDRPLLEKIGKNRFVLFLKHRPLVNGDAAGLFDLQLSGHVHHGQIFPFRFLSRIPYPMPSGLNRLPSGSAIYVSRGTGTWGPPIRFLAPPEVTVIDLVRPKKG